MGKLDGRVCIVTGAARGIGKAIGLRLAEEGAKVVFADIDGQEAEVAAAEAHRRGSLASALQVDVTSRKSIQDLIKRTVSAFGRLDVMFNNAGIFRTELFLEASEENWEKLMRVNVLGVMLGTIEAAKQMIAQGGGGKIVNTTSQAAKNAHPICASYSASKAGVVAFTQAAAKELAKYKISVNAIAPGIVATPMWAQIDREILALGLSSELGQATQAAGAATLLGRPAEPEEIAGTCVFLASSDSDVIIGQTINVCGGMIFW